MNGMTGSIAMCDSRLIATLPPRLRASEWTLSGVPHGVSVFAEGSRSAPSLSVLGLMRQRHY
jgi:hypothetical protein